MNSYQWEDISVGMEEQFRVIVSEEMMDMFRHITGDSNPLHNDTAFAAQRGYPDRVAYGMLTASFLSTLAGVYLPGEKSLIHSIEGKFVKPVYVGDELTVSGIVKEMDERFHCFWMKVEIHNQKNEKVLRGSMQIGIIE
jgi:3-hydroxybutyryl-CoA dehydratase